MQPQPPSSLISTPLILLIYLVIYIVFAYPMYVIAQKTNQENPWYAFVPILNVLQMVQIAGKEWWWVLLCFIPCVNIVVFIILWMAIAEAMNKPSWLAFVMLVPVVGIFVPFYLAFG